MKTITFLPALLLLLVSCEDLIEIELETIEPRLVVEGSISDICDHCTIKLSKTGDYFAPGTYPPVSDARLSIMDEAGIETGFEETEPGSYVSERISIIPDRTYSLEVSVEGELYSAELTMPRRIEIDSLYFGIPPSILELEEGLMVFCQVYDPGEEKNYYRMKAYRSSDPDKAAGSKVLFNDNFTNGIRMVMPWEADTFQPGDTVVVELQTLDRGSYDYFRTMFTVTAGGLFSSANPSNPVTNLSNGALGYFGSYTVSRDTLIISL